MKHIHYVNLGYPKTATTWLFENLIQYPGIDYNGIKENSYLPNIGYPLDPYINYYWPYNISLSFAPNQFQLDSKQYKDKLSKFDGIDNAFHPTQQNIPEMASIFSAVGILGSLFGGGARNSGMNALSSMTGMMEGWKIGDAEKFKREKATFDENRLQQRQQIDLIMKEWEQIAKEYTVNKEKAKADADVLIAKLGSGFLSETYRNEG